MICFVCSKLGYCNLLVCNGQKREVGIARIKFTTSNTPEKKYSNIPKNEISVQCFELLHCPSLLSGRLPLSMQSTEIEGRETALSCWSYVLAQFPNAVTQRPSLTGSALGAIAVPPSAGTSNCNYVAGTAWFFPSFWWGSVSYGLNSLKWATNAGLASPAASRRTQLLSDSTFSTAYSPFHCLANFGSTPSVATTIPNRTWWPGHNGDLNSLSYCFYWWSRRTCK